MTFLKTMVVVASSLAIALPGDIAFASVQASSTSQSFSGSGDSVIVVTPIARTVLVTMTHDGASNFSVVSKTSNDDWITLLANVIGPYSGTRIQELTKSKKLGLLEVTADGNWTIAIRPLGTALSWRGTSISGVGDAVVKVPRRTKRGHRLIMNHVGSSNFVVITYSKKGRYMSLKANDIGDYSGTRTFGRAAYISIEADGTWTLTRKK